MAVSVSGSALKWQGWAVGLSAVAALLVFAPLGLYVWAGDGSGGAPPPRAATADVRVTGCRVDAASRRVVAAVEAAGRPGGVGAYVVTVEFREQAEPVPGGRAAQALVKVPGVAPGAVERGEAVGPVWQAAAVPWCGVAAAEFTRAEPTPAAPAPGP
ncbi:hypothetical protein HYE82_27620 [Streptomyces sp. BR123]|uniref:hypothetical protein n=1 Tax=Streptomyces sp. BR123 TaxID=2749828 RepID=UPI0015C4DDA4|nr:hypothetical protein [Streptomyces sp. BR123]NXY98076.1 hypothetical protein [Streptomyces sp. BR123]